LSASIIGLESIGKGVDPALTRCDDKKPDLSAHGVRPFSLCRS
jgi:hypothetical protein